MAADGSNKRKPENDLVVEVIRDIVEWCPLSGGHERLVRVYS